MRNYQARLDSFANCPIQNIVERFERFAQAGFFYEQNGWTADDDPFIDHAKYLSDCIHLQAVKGCEWIGKYVPVMEALHQNVGGSNARRIGQLLCPRMYRRSHSLHVYQTVSQYVTPRGRPFVQPLHPQYRENKERRRTLRGRNQRRSKLAAAGFFCTGTSKLLRCYYCSIEMYDNDEDPFERHVQLNENCFHVILEKEETFVNHVRSRRMNREAVQEEALETTEPNGRQACQPDDTLSCDICRRPREISAVVCCVRCRNTVCLDGDCLYPSCCR